LFQLAFNNIPFALDFEFVLSYSFSIFTVSAKAKNPFVGNNINLRLLPRDGNGV